jgi:hypothetical protein
MIGMTSRSTFSGGKVKDAASRANFTNLTHAAAIRLTARHSIRKGSKARGRDEQGRFKSAGRVRPSMPGTPPHTRKGQIKRAILYSVERPGARAGTGSRAFIGPSYEMMGVSASAHEFGGRFRGQRYPRRAFMGPALRENLPRLPRMWAGSVR